MLEVFQTVGRDLYLTGLVSSHTGTLSIRTDSGVVISRRDAMLGQLGPEDLLEITLDGESSAQAPADALIHRAIYRSTSAGGVIHARPPATMALALIEDRLSPANGEGADLFGTVPVAISQRPISSVEIADLIGQMLKESRIVALRGHGVFAWGTDLNDALHMVSLLDEMCRIAHLFRTLGREEEQPRFHDRPERQSNLGPFRQPNDSRAAPHHPRRSNVRQREPGRRRPPTEPRNSMGPFRP